MVSPECDEFVHKHISSCRWWIFNIRCKRAHYTRASLVLMQNQRKIFHLIFAGSYDRIMCIRNGFRLNWLQKKARCTNDYYVCMQICVRPYKRLQSIIIQRNQSEYADEMPGKFQTHVSARAQPTPPYIVQSMWFNISNVLVFMFSGYVLSYTFFFLFISCVVFSFFFVLYCVSLIHQYESFEPWHVDYYFVRRLLCFLFSLRLYSCHLF